METQKSSEQEKNDYINNSTQKELLYDIGQILYWINENIKELNTSINHARNKE